MGESYSSAASKPLQRHLEPQSFVCGPWARTGGPQALKTAFEAPSPGEADRPYPFSYKPFWRRVR